MKRKLLLLCAISLLIGTISIIYAVIEKMHRKKLAYQNLEALTNLPLFDLDSTRIYLIPDRRTILIYYDSECDYCQNEIKEISTNMDFFKNLDVVFMSSELISAIKFFKEKSRQLHSDNIRFTKINREEADKTFGSLVVPQIFIYGTDGNLIKKFGGETKIGALLQYL